MGFDPKRHIMKLKGKDYLPVAARLVWFRDEHPDWGIVTTPVEINMEKQYAIFSASIFNGEGKLMATATKMENIGGFGDFIEKAETGSVGRALAYCGYGTQFAPELEEGSRFADAPFGNGGGGGNFNNSANRFASGANNGSRSNGNGYNGGNSGGNGYNNAPRPTNNAPQAARPSALPPPPRHDDDFGGDGEGEPQVPPAARPVAAAAARPAAPVPIPSGNSGDSGVMRVREPERDFGDPGGDDEEDEDPFADEADAPPAAPVVKAASGRSAAAPLQADTEDDAPIAPPVTSNKCSIEGCGAQMPPAMVGMTTAKYGRPLCPVHQKGATPLIGGNVSVGVGGTMARSRPKAGAASGGDSGGLL